MGLTPRRPAVLPVLVRPVPRLLDARSRRRRGPGYLCHPRRRHDQHRPAAVPARPRRTVVFATPTYALHLAELAAKEGIDLAGSPVRALVVAGEPGGNIPATRERIEAVWGAASSTTTA